MKAEELAKELLEHPSFEVTVSVDTSVDGIEKTYGDRTFGSGLTEVMRETHRDRFTLLFEESYDNTESRDRIKLLEQLVEKMASDYKDKGKIHHATLAKAAKALAQKQD